MTIEKNNIKINNDEEYLLKNKIRKFFNYKNCLFLIELNYIVKLIKLKN